MGAPTTGHRTGCPRSSTALTATSPFPRLFPVATAHRRPGRFLTPCPSVVGDGADRVEQSYRRHPTLRAKEARGHAATTPTIALGIGRRRPPRVPPTDASHVQRRAQMRRTRLYDTALDLQRGETLCCPQSQADPDPWPTLPGTAGLGRGKPSRHRGRRRSRRRPGRPGRGTTPRPTRRRGRATTSVVGQRRAWARPDCSARQDQESTAENRSPISSTRRSTSDGVNRRSRSPSPSAPWTTSSHVRGVDTDGPSRARSE